MQIRIPGGSAAFGLRQWFFFTGVFFTGALGADFLMVSSVGPAFTGRTICRLTSDPQPSIFDLSFSLFDFRFWILDFGFSIFQVAPHARSPESPFFVPCSLFP